MLGFWIIMGVTALGTLAFWHKLKLWTVVLIGFNLMFATLLSIGLIEMLANLLDGAWAPISYYSEMDVFLLLFLLIFVILMMMTAKISKANLAFEKKTDTISKWIACFVVIIGFAGTACYTFYIMMPEKPKDLNEIPYLPTMRCVDLISGGSLSPLLGSDTFNTADFVSREMKKNAGVYKATVDNDTRKFDGDSPNAQ